jgi:hypothetical protein
MFGGSELEAALLVILVVAAIEAWRLRHAGPNLVLLEMRVGSDQTTGEFRTPGSAAGVNRSAGEAVPVGGSTGHGSTLAHELDVWGGEQKDADRLVRRGLQLESGIEVRQHRQLALVEHGQRLRLVLAGSGLRNLILQILDFDHGLPDGQCIRAGGLQQRLQGLFVLVQLSVELRKRRLLLLLDSGQGRHLGVGKVEIFRQVRERGSGSGCDRLSRHTDGLRR